MFNYNYDAMPIKLKRECKAIKIPDGIPLILNKDAEVRIQQVLGGMFTVETEDWFLARIDGLDADALGEVVPDDRKPIDPEILEKKPLRELIFDQLRTVYDPEIPVNIVDLGLVYECDIIRAAEGKSDVQVQMTLTAPGCGMGGILKTDVEERIREIPTVREIKVDLVFDPPWDREMMSEAARLELGMM